MKKLMIGLFMMSVFVVVMMAQAPEKPPQVPAKPTQETLVKYKDLQLQQARAVVRLYQLQAQMQQAQQENQSLSDQIQKMIDAEQQRVDAKKEKWLIDPNTLEATPVPSGEAKKP